MTPARSAAAAAATVIAVLAIVPLDHDRTGGVTARPAASESLDAARTERPTGALRPVARRSGSFAVGHASGACRIPTAQELRLTLNASTTAPGDRLTAAAAIGVVAEDGAVIGPRTDRVDIWWDLDFDRWWSALTGRPVAAGGGPSRRVASVAARGACAFKAAFAVPDANAGSHVVVAIALDRRDGGAAAYGPAYVTVR